MLPMKIIASGKALPSRCVTSGELDVLLGKPEGFVKKKSGVAHRYFADEIEHQSELAAAALRDALTRHAIPAASIDLLLSATGVSEQALPSTACRIMEPAGLPNGTPAFDINASCLSFLAALQLAASLLHAGTYRRIAIVASDLASRGLNWDDHETSLIFGDGAAAVIVERGDGRTGIEAFRMETYPQGKALCEIRAGGTRRTPRRGADAEDFLFRMDGRGVFRLAAQVMDRFIEQLFAGVPLGPRDMDLVIPHQASHLAMQHIGKRLGMPPSQVMNIYATHGNQVAASMPTALHEAIIGGRLAPGSRALLIGTAAGMTVGGMVLVL